MKCQAINNSYNNLICHSQVTTSRRVRRSHRHIPTLPLAVTVVVEMLLLMTRLANVIQAASTTTAAFAFPHKCFVSRHTRRPCAPLWTSSATTTTTTTTTSRLLDSSVTAGYETLFDVALPEGRCVGLRIGQLESTDKETTNTTTFAPWVYEVLHPAEVEYATQLSSATSQKSFIGGRLALRQAMECQIQDCIILKDVHGRPKLPPSFMGSISHKGDVAVALVAPSSPQRNVAIGVDLEVRQRGHKKIAPRILTPGEQTRLGSLPDVDAEEEVLLRFSVKEAIYKAMHPLICQYVSFQEAETQPLADGTVDVYLNLTSGAHKGFESASANWRVVDDFFLTSSRVRLKPGVEPKTSKENPDECKM